MTGAYFTSNTPLTAQERESLGRTLGTVLPEMLKSVIHSAAMSVALPELGVPHLDDPLADNDAYHYELIDPLKTALCAALLDADNRIKPRTLVGVENALLEQREAFLAKARNVGLNVPDQFAETIYDEVSRRLVEGIAASRQDAIINGLVERGARASIEDRQRQLLQRRARGAVRQMHAQNPLSETAVAWLARGTPNSGDIANHLSRFTGNDERLEESLLPLLPVAAEVYNRVANAAINVGATQEGDYLSYREFVSRLKTSQKTLPAKLRESIPNITDAQVTVLSNYYNAWCHRVKHSLSIDGHVR